MLTSETKHRFKGAANFAKGSAGNLLSAGKNYLTSDFHRYAMRGIKEGFGFGLGKTMLGKVGGGLFGMAISAGIGFSQDGARGAIKSLAGDALLFGAIGGITKGAALPVLFGAAGLAAAGLGAHMAYRGESPIEYFTKGAVKQHMAKHSGLEMGQPLTDPYGNTSTMRQRSLNAIMNSRLNGRNALGNEGRMFHRGV